MAQQLETRHHEVLVVGGGSAGVSAAIAASQSGRDVALVEAGPSVGGELISGLPIDGCLNARGEWIVGGVADTILRAARDAGGFAEAVCDWRQIYAVCVDPEYLKVAIIQELARAGVKPYLYTYAEDVVLSGPGRVAGVVVVAKSRRILITADVVIDCSGDGDVAVLAGADYEIGGTSGELQPLSLVYRVSGVEYEAYLKFVRANPDKFFLAENPAFGVNPEQAAEAVYEAGHPFAAVRADAPPLSDAIDDGRMFPCAAIFVWPTSPARSEVGINATRLANIDATDVETLSEALSTLTAQIEMCLGFCRDEIPGFATAELAAVAPRIGVRETRRIVGEYVLTESDVVEGRKFDTGVAKGAHHVDIHGSGTDQVRIAVKDGRSYDIPFDCLIPKSLENVLVAGRCFSSSREAHGSARVMGPCMGMGEAAGVAAGIMVRDGLADTRDVAVDELRAALRERGAIVDGTH